MGLKFIAHKPNTPYVCFRRDNFLFQASGLIPEARKKNTFNSDEPLEVKRCSREFNRLLANKKIGGKKQQLLNPDEPSALAAFGSEIKPEGTNRRTKLKHLKF